MLVIRVKHPADVRCFVPICVVKRVMPAKDATNAIKNASERAVILCAHESVASR